MHKASIILVILALFSIAVVAYIWMNALVNSIYGYFTPLKGMPPLTEIHSHPLTSQVVLVLADGLRYDASFQMPYVNRLRQQGAQAKLVLHPPSSSQSSWTALLSGASAEINGAPLFDRDYECINPITVDHLFAALNRAGLTGGLSGSWWWKKLVPPDLLYVKYYANTNDEAADQLVVERALTFLNEFQPNFLLVHLQQIDAAGHMYGGSSSEYQQTVLRCDEKICLLAESMDFKRSVLIVASSHGHLDSGGHGGDEEVVLLTPFVMVGENVLAGDYGVLDQTDLAPTIAALLGIPIPAAAQGHIRMDMLKMNKADKAQKLVALANQRLHIGNIYLYSIGKSALSETAEGDVLVAHSSLEVKNYESASELALLAVQQIEREIAQARHSRLWKERNQRAVPIIIAALLPLQIIWRIRSGRTVWSVLAALLAVAFYHALSLLQGNAYSFSRTPANGLTTTPTYSLRQAVIALVLGALVVIWCMQREQERSIFTIAMRIYGYVALQLYFISLLLGVCIWWNGPRFTWYLPNFTLAYIHFATLMQVMLIAAVAIPLPFTVIVLQRCLSLAFRSVPHLSLLTRYISRHK